MNQGKLIVIEGACDGIGKSTQYQKLIGRLKQEGKKVVSHHFPTYGSYQAMPGEEYLKGSLGKKEDISPYLVNTFFAVDRAITWITKLKKEYENGSIIILDRYTTSSTLYQSSLIDDLDERKKFIDYIIDYEWNKLGIKKPDQVIFLNADFEAVQNMLKLRGDNGGVENDIYEADMVFMEKVHDNAVSVAKYLNWDIIECSKDGKMLSIDEIHDKIYDVFKNN